MATATLMILGRSVNFAVSEPCRVEGCRTPTHPGPCKGWRGKKATAGRGPAKHIQAAPKKATPKKAAGAAPDVPRGADKATDAARAKEAKRLTSKPAHQGVPMPVVMRVFQEAGKQPGADFDKNLMRVTKRTPQGTSTVEMIGQGYRAVVRRNGQPEEAKVFRDIGAAFADAAARLLKS